jgi:hypothetical protein
MRAARVGCRFGRSGPPASLSCIVSAVEGYAPTTLHFRGDSRSGVKRSRAEEDQRGLIVLTLTGYEFAEATNWPKVKSLLTTELYGFTRDYERRFGAPSGTNDFVSRFQEAKLLADRIEKEMVPVSALGQVIGSSRVTNGAK